MSKKMQVKRMADSLIQIKREKREFADREVYRDKTAVFLKKILPPFCQFMLNVWLSMAAFIFASYLQQKGLIFVIPEWVTAYIPDWFMRYGLAEQLLLSLILPAIAISVSVISIIYLRTHLARKWR